MADLSNNSVQPEGPLDMVLGVAVLTNINNRSPETMVPGLFTVADVPLLVDVALLRTDIAI